MPVFAGNSEVVELSVKGVKHMEEHMADGKVGTRGKCVDTGGSGS